MMTTWWTWRDGAFMAWPSDGDTLASTSTTAAGNTCPRGPGSCGRVLTGQNSLGSATLWKRSWCHSGQRAGMSYACTVPTTGDRMDSESAASGVGALPAPRLGPSWTPWRGRVQCRRPGVGKQFTASSVPPKAPVGPGIQEADGPLSLEGQPAPGLSLPPSASQVATRE